MNGAHLDGIIRDLQVRLHKAEEDLLQTKADNLKMNHELFQCKSELKQERYLNKILMDYVPEDQFEMLNGQMVWNGSSPVSILCDIIPWMLRRQMSQVKDSI